MNESQLLGATISDLQAAMAAGRLTSEKLVAWYIERIARYDKQGPAINAVLEVNPEALHIAAALDRERELRGSRGLLHGIPVLLKDNIDTHDKMHTSAGSLALANSIAPRDSFIAKRLREEGAVILGKANMTEWANFMTQGMPNGYSSRGGQVLNPYGPGRFDVGGSSSGSGAAVAADFTTIAVGTETSGSILSPASANSLVGIKPTVGLISRAGVIPISNSQDTAGPMARTVADAAILLGALTGVDPEDPATYVSEGLAHRDYTRFLDKNGLKGARLGVQRQYMRWLRERHKDKVAVFDQALDVLRQLGATIIDPVEMPANNHRASSKVLVYEFKPNLNAYLQQVGSCVPVHSLAEVIEFNNRHADKALKYGQSLLEASQATSGTLTEPEYLEAKLRNLRLAREEGIDYALREYRLDALVSLNNWGAMLPAIAGYPSITVPAGYTADGEPVGLTFTASAFEEPALLALAYAFEQAANCRKPPELQ